MALSDNIARFLEELMAAMDGVAEVQRQELASRFSCVPSQINYVLATRFSPEHGFLVESRRGGGGYIRIRRVPVDREGLTMHAVNAIGEAIDPPAAAAFLQNLTAAGALSTLAAHLIAAALSDRALRNIPPPYRDGARAGILKQCLLTML